MVLSWFEQDYPQTMKIASFPTVSQPCSNLDIYLWPKHHHHPSGLKTTCQFTSHRMEDQSYAYLVISQDNRPQVGSTSHKMKDLKKDTTQLVISQDNKPQVISTSHKMEDLNMTHLKSKLWLNSKTKSVGLSNYTTQTRILNLRSHEIMQQVNILWLIILCMK
jgi:hypothetical protein